MASDTNEMRRQRLGVYWIFAVTGIAFATWIARVPALRDNLQITTAQVGIFLLAAAVGSLVGLGLSSHITAYIGSRRTILVFGSGALMSVVAVGVISVVVPALVVAMVAMFVFGLTASITDVAMNVEGAEVERQLGRTIMPWFHALFSVGTAVGGGIAALASFLGIGVGYHFTLMGGLLLIPTVYSVKLMGWVEPMRGVSNDEQPRSTLRERLGVWLEPRTLLIGVVALSMAFAEGSANDWLALAMVDDRGYTNAQGAIWFVVFTSSMTLGRILGVPLIDRFGRVAILVSSALAALAGLAVVITVDHPVATVIAVVAWGLGSALGFPVAISAAADDPHNGPARVSAVATIAYSAFFVGPPLIGGIAEVSSILTALWVVAGVIAVGLVATGATRKPTP